MNGGNQPALLVAEQENVASSLEDRHVSEVTTLTVNIKRKDKLYQGEPVNFQPNQCFKIRVGNPYTLYADYRPFRKEGPKATDCEVRN